MPKSTLKPRTTQYNTIASALATQQRSKTVPPEGALLRCRFRNAYQMNDANRVWHGYDDDDDNDNDGRVGPSIIFKDDTRTMDAASFCVIYIYMVLNKIGIYTDRVNMIFKQMRHKLTQDIMQLNKKHHRIIFF